MSGTAVVSDLFDDPLPDGAPRAPKTIEETGLPRAFLLDLLLKSIHVLGLERLGDMAREIALPEGLIDELVEEGRERGLVIAMGSTRGDYMSEMRYALSDGGRRMAEEALLQSRYIGPCPVPLETFKAAVLRQTVRNERLGPGELAESFDGIVLPPEVVLRLGPAANSGRSILLYGLPGNGKTFVAERMGEAFRDRIYLPHAITLDGQIIKFYDEAIHRPVSAEAPAETQAGAPGPSLRKPRPRDQRWIRCRRPFVLTGGELTLDMLDLRYVESAGFYEAPLQLKATGGIFVIDDFGRQQVGPVSILNRWIVPLERRVDFLTLNTGKTFSIPFDELIVFSSNLDPSDLGDDALLRRLHYKIEIPLPTDSDFAKIWEDACRQYDCPYDPAHLEFLDEDLYRAQGIPKAGFHPIFLLGQVKALCDYEGEPMQVSREKLRMAYLNLVVTHPGT